MQFEIIKIRRDDLDTYGLEKTLREGGNPKFMTSVGFFFRRKII